MKSKFLLIAFAGNILLMSCDTVMDSNVKYTHLAPEGKNMPIQPFTSIKANGVFDLILQQGTRESVVVKGDYPSDLIVMNNGNTLVVMDTVSNHFRKHENTEIYVTFKKLDAMETESVGQIKTLDTIKTGRFVYESDGIGESILYINADSVTASENSVGILTLAGKARYATLEDNGIGALKAQDFKVDILHVSVNGVGAAKVYADSEIYLDVNGIGGVKYYGHASVKEENGNGVGKIEHAE